MNILSLFANIGVAEAYLEEIGFNVSIANEIDPKRAKLYKQIYPNTDMICGDITSESTYKTILDKCSKANIDIVMATPPCQGMSTAGQQTEFDPRNDLSLYAFSIIKHLKPKYAIIENVPEYKNTKIIYNNEPKLLLDVLDLELGKSYNISVNLINTEDYLVPQSRQRIIILLTRKDIKKQWVLPNAAKEKVTLFDAIGHLPEVDPEIKDLSKDEFQRLFPLYEKRRKIALKISPWHIPPVHVYRQVLVMQHTPTGGSAFDNAVYKPTKKDGTLVKGYHNTYSRQRWDTPAFTVTMDNRKISSQGNVHPGRYIGKDANGDDIYSDPRTLTLYELMLVMSIPHNWAIPKDTKEPFIRRIIGEGIPPLFIKQLFENIL
jgi:DNA (cytosine-5)-methyltransferase 1